MMNDNGELEMTKTDRKTISTVAKALSAQRILLAKMETEYAEMRLKALRTVEMTKVGETITLEAGKRVIKAKKNSHGRFKVTEGKTTLSSEYMGGIHDLRFDIAMGAI